MTERSFSQAEAFANIALIKYWGKQERPGNYPAVPSLSLTLSGLRTTTTVTLDDELTEDVVTLDSVPAVGRPRERIVKMLDTFRERTRRNTFARVESQNEFPTAAGLASSSSGFAALACAANASFSAGLSVDEQSSLARAASASAARSLYGGFVTLEAGAESAMPLAPAGFWDLVLLVAVTATGKKAIGSTEAMNLTRSTSPYYPTWVDYAPRLFERAKQAVLARDLEVLGAAMEQSTLMMHATMHTASPAILYQTPATIAVMKEIHALRARGTLAFFTMDAGPHVKVLCASSDAVQVRACLRQIDGVRDVLRATPGNPAHIVAQR
jgi:diphosphomevalonate decarboxylase